MKPHGPTQNPSLPPVPSWILNSMPAFIRSMGFKYAINTNHIEITNLISEMGTKTIILRALREQNADGITRLVEKSKRLRFYLALLEPLDTHAGVLRLTKVNTPSCKITGVGRLVTEKGKPMLYIIALLPPSEGFGKSSRKFTRTYLTIGKEPPHSVGDTEYSLSDDQYRGLINALQRRFQSVPIEQILSGNQASN